MNIKKQTKKEKQLLKQKSKQEKENIIKKYLDEINSIIDKGYLEIYSVIEEFNQELMECTLEYSNLENIIKKMFKEEELSIETLAEINERVEMFEEKNVEIYNTITSRDMKENKILRHLPDIAEKVANVISNATDDLENNKNQAYLTSMIINRSFSIFKSYNSFVVDTALESNSYIDTYVDTREGFIDFVEECKKTIDEIQAQNNMKEELEQIDKTFKYKQRLRVNYSELESFLRHKGYECNRQGSTTHAVWRHTETGKSMPLPSKSGTIPQGTTSKVLKQMGSNRQELADFLYA